MIQVVVVDDLEVIRLGLRQALTETQDIQLLAGCADVEELCELSDSVPVDVVVLDDTLPGSPVSQAAQEIQACWPKAAVLVFGERLTPGAIQRLFRAGVRGFLCKEEPARELLATAVRRVAWGKVYLSPEAALISRREDPTRALTPRMEQMLALIAQGRAISEIAAPLNLSARAAYSERERLRELFSVETDVQLVLAAIHWGVLSER